MSAVRPSASAPSAIVTVRQHCQDAVTTVPTIIRQLQGPEHFRAPGLHAASVSAAQAASASPFVQPPRG